MIDELLIVDELSQLFDDAWNLIDWSAAPGGRKPVILWEGRATTQPPPVGEAYVRFTITPVDARQASLGATKIWDNAGIISVQCFGPDEDANGYEISNYVAIMAKRVFQGNASPNGIWFRNCRANRIGPSGGWYQFNTLIEYQFNEQR